MSYNALDVARYVVNQSQDIGYPVSNLKLQKLLYFIQGYFLILMDGPCFNEKIEAWGFGPVVPCVYQEFKMYGSNNIPKIDSVFKLNEEDPWDSGFVLFDDSIFNNSDKELILKIISVFKNISATALVEMTHKHDTWKKVYSENTNNEISLESMKTLFSRRYLKHDN